jgi:hypothetical protein
VFTLTLRKKKNGEEVVQMGIRDNGSFSEMQDFAPYDEKIKGKWVHCTLLVDFNHEGGVTFNLRNAGGESLMFGGKPRHIKGDCWPEHRYGKEKMEGAIATPKWGIYRGAEADNAERFHEFDSIEIANIRFFKQTSCHGRLSKLEILRPL